MLIFRGLGALAGAVGLFLLGDSVWTVHKEMPGQESLVTFACFGALLIVAGGYLMGDKTK